MGPMSLSVGKVGLQTPPVEQASAGERLPWEAKKLQAGRKASPAKLAGRLARSIAHLSATDRSLTLPPALGEMQAHVFLFLSTLSFIDAEMVLNRDHQPLPVMDLDAPHLPHFEGSKPLPPGAKR